MIKRSFKKSLKDAAALYLQNAVQLYLKIEGNVSIFNNANLGDSANIICSTNRSIEHLSKLKLALIDPVLIYPLPKTTEQYLQLRSINIKSDRKLAPVLNTIGFNEAIKRVKLLPECKEGIIAYPPEKFI